MTAHVVIEIKVIDKEMYALYMQQVPPIVKQFGGRYLVRAGKITTISGDWRPERVILLEFDSAAQVRKWLTSPEYAAVAPLREKPTISRAIVIERGDLP
jgi:uncharacterized protein (DUF1330 family)